MTEKDTIPTLKTIYQTNPNAIIGKQKKFWLFLFYYDKISTDNT